MHAGYYERKIKYTEPNYLLDQHYTLSVTFICQSTTVVLVGPLAVAGMVL